MASLPARAPALAVRQRINHRRLVAPRQNAHLLHIYDAKLQKSTQYQLQYQMTNAEQLQNLLSGRTQLMRKSIDSLNLPILKDADGSYYVYSAHSKLYEKSKDGLHIAVALASDELTTILEAERQRVQTALDAILVPDDHVRQVRNLTRQLDQLFKVQKTVDTLSSMQGILKACLSFSDPHKVSLLDKHPFNWPTLDGTKFDSYTLAISNRTHTDLFTEELFVSYLPNLLNANNLYYRLKQSQYTIRLELEWAVLCVFDLNL